jgi:GWxTD domain-containing protein
MAPFRRLPSPRPRATCTEPGAAGRAPTGRRRAGLQALGAMLVAVLCCRAPPPSSAAAAARAWGAGPARWLLLPEEQRALRQVRSVEELDGFLQQFWARRASAGDPRGEQLARLIAERIADADHLYAEGETRGSLSDRGRALILLGSPPVLRATRRRVPVATAASGQMRPTRLLPQEEWVYPTEELPTGVVEALAASPGREVVLLFLLEGGRMVLVQGEEVLQQAARALASRQPGAEG